LKIKDKSARLRAGLLPRLATTFKSTADWIEARGCTRLVLVGFFLSIIIKRFNRR
jgi:hypothetical protein